MNTYYITWEIEVEADSREEAARMALEIQRDRNSTATVFEVHSKGSDKPIYIDVAEMDRVGKLP